MDQVKFPKQTGNCGVHASSTWCWMDGGYTIGALSDNQARTGSTLTSNATFFYKKLLPFTRHLLFFKSFFLKKALELKGVYRVTSTTHTEECGFALNIIALCGHHIL